MNALLPLLALACIFCPTSYAAESSLDELVGKAFPGRTLESLGFQEIEKLNPATRNQIVAVICESSPPNTRELTFLRDLSNQNVLTNANVVGPLIAALKRAAPESPSTPESVRTGLNKENGHNIRLALQILRQLTRRDCGDAVGQGREKNLERIREMIEWWGGWWTKNRDKHPMIDAELETTLKRRVAAIEAQLVKDLVPDYYEPRHLRPNETRIRYQEPLYDRVIDSSLLSEGIMSRGSDGKERVAAKVDHTFLRIRVGFGTPLPRDEIDHADGEVPKRWQPLLQQVFHEDVPGTDIVIQVDAASNDSAFVRRVRESLAKLPPRAK